LKVPAKSGRSETGRLFECPAQVRVVGETTGVRHVHDRILRMEEESESLADPDFSKMIAKRISEKSAKTVRHMHRMNADREG